MAMNKDVIVSVVIPAYNEAEAIAHCLTSFVAQQTNVSFEVIVVDNASTDDTREAAESFKDTLTMRVIREEKKGRGAARAAGFAAARGELVFSADADTVVPHDWIDILVRNLRSSEIVAVTGPCRINDCSGLVNVLFSAFQPLSMHVYRLLYGHYWLSGFSCGIRKEIYQKSGGFDPELNAQEDTDLSFRVSKLGRIKYVPESCVLASGRRFRNGLIKGLLSYFTTFMEYRYKKTHDVYLGDVRN